MTNYTRMYRFGFAPWERYATAAAASISALLDREETGRSRPLGRALDLGCGRGQYTPELARRGWEAVGVDHVAAAIEAAKARSRGADRLSYVVGDVTRPPSAGLGTFDFFLGIGCFQGLDAVCAARFAGPTSSPARTIHRTDIGGPFGRHAEDVIALILRQMRQAGPAVSLGHRPEASRAAPGQ